jgi:hypothetical protein
MKKGIFSDYIKSIRSLNNSKFFAGIVMLMLNIGSKYITIELSKSQEQYLRNSIARQLLIFSIAWMGTKDVFIALGLTAVFNILTQFLFNENSQLCVIPKRWRNYTHLIEKNEKDIVTDRQVKEAQIILEKSKRQNEKKEQFRLMAQFSNL